MYFESINPYRAGRFKGMCIYSVDWNIPMKLTTSLRTWSGTFLVVLHSALAEEWENITGAVLTSSAAFIVCTAAFVRSTNIPSRFISLTTLCNHFDWINWFWKITYIKVLKIQLFHVCMLPCTYRNSADVHYFQLQFDGRIWKISFMICTLHAVVVISHLTNWGWVDGLCRQLRNALRMLLNDLKGKRPLQSVRYRCKNGNWCWICIVLSVKLI